MAFDLLILGAQVATSETVEAADVGIKDGRIAAIGDLKQSEGGETLRADGLTLMPGAIDTQVHFREPGMEHKEDLESGTRAAVCGGVTTIFEMPNTRPNTTTRETLEDKLGRADGRAWCDYSFFVGAAVDNADRLAQLEMAPGTPGIKIFMGSSTGSLLVSETEDLRAVLLAGKRRCSIHAEDEPRNTERKALISAEPHPREHPFLRDAESARLATERILNLSAETGRPVHVLHVSTADELPLLANAKMRDLGTTCEVTPQHLWFAAPDCYDRLGSHAQMNPPIRSEEHRAALWEAVGKGLFDVFGSDHAPHTVEEKALPYPQSPSGMPGVQTLMPVLLTFVRQGKLALTDVVRMACENPARIFGIRDVGFVREGMFANLALFDLARTETVEKPWLQSKCGWSPFEGEALTGWPVHTLVRGGFAVREGALVGGPSGKPTQFDWKE